MACKSVYVVAKELFLLRPPVGGFFMNIITYPHSEEARHLYSWQNMYISIFTPSVRRESGLSVQTFTDKFSGISSEEMLKHLID